MIKNFATTELLINTRQTARPNSGFSARFYDHKIIVKTWVLLRLFDHLRNIASRLLCRNWPPWREAMHLWM